jgi:hypothetical protein
MKNALVLSGLIFSTTYVSGLLGLPIASQKIGVTLGYDLSSQLALISAVIACCTKFIEEWHRK